MSWLDDIGSWLGDTFGNDPGAGGRPMPGGVDTGYGVLPAPGTGAGPQPNPYGGAFGLGPMTWQQKAALGLGAVGDAFNGMRGAPANAFQGALGGMQQRQFAGQMNSAIGDGSSPNVPAIRAMALHAIANGQDPTPWLNAIKFGRPTVEHVGDSLVSVDPFTDETAPLFKGQRQPQAGYEWNPDGKGQHYIVGGPGDPTVIGRTANVRDAASEAHRKKPATGPLGPRTGPFD